MQLEFSTEAILNRMINTIKEKGFKQGELGNSKKGYSVFGSFINDRHNYSSYNYPYYYYRTVKELLENNLPKKYTNLKDYDFAPHRKVDVINYLLKVKKAIK